MKRFLWVVALIGIAALQLVFLQKIRVAHTPSLHPKSTPTPAPSPSAFKDPFPYLPLFQTIRKSDPKAYAEFIAQLESHPFTDSGNEQAGAALARILSGYLQPRLKTASKDTLIAFQRRRLEGYRQLMHVSPGATYAHMRHFPYRLAADKNRTWLTAEMLTLQTDLFEILTAPPGDPLPYDEERASKNANAVFERLTQEQFEFLTEPEKTATATAADKKRYCLAFLRLYEEVLKLPTEDAIELFRYLEELPPDGRV